MQTVFRLWKKNRCGDGVALGGGGGGVMPKNCVQCLVEGGGGVGGRGTAQYLTSCGHLMEYACGHLMQ